MSKKDRTGRNWSRERDAYRYDLPDSVVEPGTPRPERICRDCAHFRPDRLEANCPVGRLRKEGGLRLYDVGPLQPGCEHWTDKDNPQTTNTMETKTTPTTKVCSKCKRELPAEAFGKKTRSKDGLQDYCLECQREANKAYHAKKMAQKAKAKAVSKAIAAKLPEKVAKSLKEDDHKLENHCVEIGITHEALKYFNDVNLVQELRNRGYEVKATKIVEL